MKQKRCVMVSKGRIIMILLKTTMTICNNNMGKSFSVPSYSRWTFMNNDNINNNNIGGWYLMNGSSISCCSSSCLRKYYHHQKHKLLFQSSKKSNQFDEYYYDNNRVKNGTTSASSFSVITGKTSDDVMKNDCNSIIGNKNKLLVEMEKMIYDDGNMEKVNTLYEEIIIRNTSSSPSSSARESRENVNVIKQAMKVILKGIRKHQQDYERSRRLWLDVKKYSIAMDGVMIGQFLMIGCSMEDIEFVKEMIEFGRKNKLKVFIFTFS